MNSQQYKRLLKKKPSLRRGLLLRMLLCWVVPVFLAVTLAGLFVAKATTDKTTQMVEASAKNSLDILQNRVDSAVEASLASSYKPHLRNAWREYQRSGDYVTYATEAQEFLDEQYKYDDKFFFTGIMLTQQSDYRFHITNNYPFYDIMFFWQNVSPRVAEISKSLDTKIAFIEEGGHLYIFRNLMDEEYNSYAILIMELNQKALTESLSGVTWATDVTFWLDNTRICLMGEPLMWDTKSKNDNAVHYTSTNLPISVSGIRTTERYLLRYSILADQTLITNQINNTRIMLLISLGFLIPLFITIFSFMFREITKPVGSLIDAARKIERGHFGALVDEKSVKTSEMSYLNETFNAMSLTLKNQFERMYKEEIALRDAKIMALQSQINPHFLNNTLEIINWEARLCGDVKVCKMLEALSTMLNAAMDRKNRPVVHLSEELMYVDSYLYIIRERLGKRLTVKKEINDLTLDCYVPRLVLQPIIENAVEHGISPLQKGTITIRSYKGGDKLYLEIENDGEVQDEDIDRITRLLSFADAPTDITSTSLGIRNVNQRLKILYGLQSGLTIKKTDNNTTLAQICIKIKQDEQ